MIKAYLSLFLAAVHALTGLTILLVSTWFIAISAVAPVGFNYMIPAVVIRALALLRIASGYATKWVGHDDMLARVAANRLALFTSLQGKRINQKAWLTEALATHTQAIASNWIAWIAPFTSAILMLSMALVIAFWLNLPSTRFLVGLGIFWSAAVTVLCVIALKQAVLQRDEELAFRERSASFLSSSAIWHLYPRASAVSQAPSALPLRKLQIDRGKHVQLFVWALQGVSLILVGLSLGFATDDTLATPMAVIIPMLLLAAPDWLGPGLHAVSAYADCQVSQANLAAIKAESVEPVGEVPVKCKLALRDFRPSGRAQTPVDLNVAANATTILLGSSGCGKSGLMQAMAGILPYDGKRVVDECELSSGMVSTWVYVEQQPVVLSGTLRMNLDPAKRGIDDRAMERCLEALQLQALLPLESWLGQGGRTLSGGEAKRLALGRAILSDASLLLVDEPFEGLDAGAQNAVANIINQLRQTKPVVIATHIIPDTLQCDTVWSFETGVRAMSGERDRQCA